MSKTSTKAPKAKTSSFAMRGSRLVIGPIRGKSRHSPFGKSLMALLGIPSEESPAGKPAKDKSSKKKLPGKKRRAAADRLRLLAMSDSELAAIASSNTAPTAEELAVLGAALDVAAERSPALGRLAQDLRARAESYTSAFGSGPFALGRALRGAEGRSSLASAIRATAARAMAMGPQEADKAVFEMIRGARDQSKPFWKKSTRRALANLGAALDGTRCMGPLCLAELASAYGDGDHSDCDMLYHSRADDPDAVQSSLARLPFLDIFQDPLAASPFRCDALRVVGSEFSDHFDTAYNLLLDAWERESELGLSPGFPSLMPKGCRTENHSVWESLGSDNMEHLKPSTSARAAKALGATGSAPTQGFIDRALHYCHHASAYRDPAVALLRSIPGIFTWRDDQGRSLACLLNQEMRQHARDQSSCSHLAKAFTELASAGMDASDIMPVGTPEALAAHPCVLAAIERKNIGSSLDERVVAISKARRI